MQGPSSCDNMKLGLTDSLRGFVHRKFQAARTSGDLLFSNTELSVLRSKQGVPFQLRYCPALAKKPKNNVSSPTRKEQPKPKPDPFENPIPQLLIREVPSHKVSHILVLNKYPVIHNHFILATKPNKPQTDILEEDDLSTSYACIKAWQHESQQNRLFAFFNSGEHSGASQAHRHLQFLPVEDMMTRVEGSTQWRLLTDGMTTGAHSQLPLLYDPALPFIHFATRIESNVSSNSLYAKYKLLLKAALSAINITSDQASSQLFSFTDSLPLTTSPNTSTTAFSYNLAMTDSILAICPRKAESVRVPNIADGNGGESLVAINGTILGGTLMVKDQSEWEALKQHPEGLDEMLQGIGYTWPSSMTSTQEQQPQHQRRGEGTQESMKL